MSIYVVPSSPRMFVDMVEERADRDLHHYSSAVLKAFGDVSPIFSRSQYSDLFWHCAVEVPGWFAQVLIANAEAESKGSAKLIRMWSTMASASPLSASILRHARDESRHSRLFLDLIDWTMRNQVERKFVDQLRKTLPDVRVGELPQQSDEISQVTLIDSLVQMNIGEIRTRVHIELFAPILAELAPAPDKAQTIKVLQTLARDEIRHITYTAELLEQAAEHGQSDLIAQLFRTRLSDFNSITAEETKGSVEAFGAGAFQDLLVDQDSEAANT